MKRNRLAWLSVLLMAALVFVPAAAAALPAAAEASAEADAARSFFAKPGSTAIDGVPEEMMEYDILLLDGAVRAGMLWDAEAAEMIVVVRSDSPMDSVVVGLNPLTVAADFSTGTVEGDASLGMSSDKTYAEIAVPMAELLPVVRDGQVRLAGRIVVETDGQNGEVSGEVAFLQLSDSYGVNLSFTGSAPFDNALGAYVMTDDGSADLYRQYCIQASGVAPLQNMDTAFYISLDLQIESLPVVEEAQMEMFDNIPQPDMAPCVRLVALKASDIPVDFERFYGIGYLLQIYNVQDQGLTLFGTSSNNSPLPPVPLNKQAGDSFHLHLFWSVENRLEVYVDGIHVGFLEDVARIRQLSTTIGAYVVDIVRGTPMPEGEETQVLHANHTVSVMDEVDVDALLALTAYVPPAEVFLPMGDVIVDGQPEPELAVTQRGSGGLRYGAAWNLEQKTLWLSLEARGTTEIDLSVGFAQGTVDCAAGTITGIEGASVAIAGHIAEIAIPIERLALAFDGAYIYTPFRIEVAGEQAGDAEGNLFFTGKTVFAGHTSGGTKLPEGGTFLKTTDFSGFHGSLTDENGVIHMTDTYSAETAENAKSRIYAILYRLPDLINSLHRDYSFRFELCVNNLPEVESWGYETAIGGPANPGRITIFAARGLASNQVITANIYHTAQGLVFVANAPTAAYQDTEDKYESVPLGKQLGDRFTLELYWTEAGDLTVSVDGAALHTFVNVTETRAKVVDDGGFSFNTYRETVLQEGEGIDVEYGNIALAYVADFDMEALAALSTVEVILPGQGDETPGGDDEGDDGDDPGSDEQEQPGEQSTDGAGADTSAPGGDAQTDPAPADDKGCRSAAGTGLMLLMAAAAGTALIGKRKPD